MTITKLFLLAAAATSLALAQAPPTILTVDLANLVQYQEDQSDPSKFATDPNITPSNFQGKNFLEVTLLGDIVAVNGQPAKGLYAGRTHQITTSVSPTPGHAIGDVGHEAVREHIFEILGADGNTIGTIMSMGFSGGALPPGMPSGPTGGNWAIVGGTGAFLGARGEVAGWGANAQFTQGDRNASITEDPAKRRLNGGGTFRFTLHMIPMTRPEVTNTAGGPAIVHSSDFTLVGASKPAAPGETLSLFATGLGPVNPGVDPGQPFPLSPLAAVNSPVQVRVNGKSAEVLGAVGYPGSVDGYQVNFRVPSDTPKGVAGIQVVAAWIAGSPVSIAVQ